MNYRELYTKRNKIKQQWLKVNPFIDKEAGIYILTRFENGFNYAYVGQTVDVLERLISHSMGYDQHIDRSLKKHKLYDAVKNKTGWQVKVHYCDAKLLDDLEKMYIYEYAHDGYQLLNKTSGSQGDDKFGISENKTKKGYYQGVEYGRKKLLKEIRVFFEKYLNFDVKMPKNRIKMRKFEEFKELLEEK